MKARKFTALLIVCVMFAGVIASCASPPAISTSVPRDTLIVAYGAEMNGDFIGGFGNNAYDATIKTMLHDFMGTYAVTPAGEFALNKTVVKTQKIDTDDAGNKTYTFTLHNDLKWSDGSAIKASDFIGGILWSASPAWREAGATSTAGECLIGYEAYNEGESEYFKGIALIDDYNFSLTIDAEELPYFYEVSYVGYGPVCMASYAPGITVVTDASGSKLSGDITADCKRIAETAGGERFEPTVVCGPYTFVSFDNQIVTLQRNPHFKGDSNGKKPKIEYVVQKAVPSDTDIDILLAGEIDLLPQMIEGAKIERAKADEYATASSYLRNGYGVLHIMCDFGPTKDPNVRWAIACLVDRTALLEQVLEGYGGLVNGEYGIAQWMYQQKEKEIKKELIPIAMNIDKANDYLDQSEWKFEADGSTPFDRSKANADGTYLRHNASGEKLVIKHASANAGVGAVLEIEWLKNTPYAGVSYTFDQPDFNLVLDQYYNDPPKPENERIYHTFSMGTGFSAAYDPYYSWHSKWIGTWYNSQGVNDPELDKLIIEMRELEPTQKKEYADAWLKYQIRWNQLLPSLPLYANEYFDLYNNSVKSVPTTPFLGWADLICEIEKWQE